MRALDRPLVVFEIFTDSSSSSNGQNAKGCVCTSLCPMQGSMEFATHFNRTFRARTNCGTPRRNKRNTNPRAYALLHPAPARLHAYSLAHAHSHFYSHFHPHFRSHHRHQTEFPDPIPPAARHPPATNPPKSSTAQTPSSPAHTIHEKIISPGALRAIPHAPQDAAGKSGNPSRACAQQ
jgi:hypothetical protein